ncbi:esterase/lipase family protein [Dactylosporangium siamense]|uniref:esterase/lipase family protein n=1 Tax=Dactylosporangium siamense TaxID=685454 RepID=UPI001944E668|nr:alpha/beta fold hydrolase [Dactylosporangium siamense]
MRRLATVVAAVLAAGLLTVVAGPAPVANAEVAAPAPVVGAGGPGTQNIGAYLQDAIRVGGAPVTGSIAASGADRATFSVQSAGCDVARPRTEQAAVDAVRAQSTSTTPCFQFARLSSEPQYLPEPRSDMSYLPYARDGVTYVTGSYNKVTSTMAEMRAVYTCQRAPLVPALPGYGSQLRTQWLAALGLSDSPTLRATYPCITDTVNGVAMLDDDTTGMTTDWVLPYAVSQFLTQSTADARGPAGRGLGIARLGRLTDAPGGNGAGPLTVNAVDYPDGVSWATTGTELPAALTVDQLQAIYRCQLRSFGSASVVPALPPVSPPTLRAAWLTAIGLTEADVRGGCVQTLPSGNTTKITAVKPDMVVPFGIQAYINTSGDFFMHGPGELRRIIRPRTLTDSLLHEGNPMSLNTGYGTPLVHRLHTAVPTNTTYDHTLVDRLFRGPGSMVCAEASRLSAFGLTRLPRLDCGGPAAVNQLGPAPARGDGRANAVYFVHGFNWKAGTSCSSTWDPAMAALRARGWTGEMHTVGYYADDTGCTDQFASGHTWTSIADLAQQVAWGIYNNQSRYGRKVDVVTHSMGGLILRYAVTAVEQRRSGFPPLLYIEDAVTIAPPNAGTWWTTFCDWYNTQCVEMLPTSNFLPTLGTDPQSAMNTDWTEIFSCADIVSDCNSSAVMNVAHHVRYGSQFNLDHSGILAATSATWNYSVHHSERHGQPLFAGDSGSGWLEGNAPGPISWTYQALNYQYLW